MKRSSFIILLVILVLTFVVRLYRFDNPIADWHSWRQADTSAVSRNFVKYGYDVLHPTYDDISNVQTGKDNPQGYRFVEFPIFNVFQAGFYQLVGIFTLEEWGRLVTIFASLGSVTFIFLLAKRYANVTVAIASSLFFSIDPFSIYYGRVILPDPSMAMTTLGGIWFLSRWLEESQKVKVKSQKVGWGHIFYPVLAVLFSALALLLKPFAIFFLVPPMVWLVFHYKRWKGFISWQMWLFGIFSVLPLVGWRIWMLQYPEGIPSSVWLLNGGNIRFTGAYFLWIFARRICRLILGWWGIVLVMCGVLHTRLKNYLFFITFIISSLAYLVIIARGNVQHDYYQILIIPTMSFLFGLGVDFIINLKTTKIHKVAAFAVIMICSLFTVAFGWFQVRDYFNINNPNIVVAGQAVDRLTPKDAKVIAIYDGDTSFLYQTNRKGWPSFEHSLEDLAKMGADYLVLVNPKPEEIDIQKKYQLVASTSAYVLFDLHKKQK